MRRLHIGLSLQMFFVPFSSSLVRRILVLNLGGLAGLLIGFLYLTEFRKGLIDARVQSLRTQGEIIAAAIAASATMETNVLTLDPDKLLNPAPMEKLERDSGERKSRQRDPILPALKEESVFPEFSINPERVGPVLRRLVSPTRTRARVYDQEGDLLLDTHALISFKSELINDSGKTEGQSDFDPHTYSFYLSFLKRLQTWLSFPSTFLVEKKIPQSAIPPEVPAALNGQVRFTTGINTKGNSVISIALPIQRFQAIRGALLLSTQGAEIDAAIAAERWTLMKVFLLCVFVMSIVSFFFARTIAEPVRRLAEAAEGVRYGINLRKEIPDFTQRQDEIGHLSGALRNMTLALYQRIEAIENFAADVAHELKNPLTSLRSAVETLPRVRSETSQRQLLAIIQHDVMRLDRLITDISEASRLDAELARGQMETLDLLLLLQTIISIAQNTFRLQQITLHVPDGTPSAFTSLPFHTDAQDIFSPPPPLEQIDPSSPPSSPPSPFCVFGNELRLSQVLNNLIDNACSFSKAGDRVQISLYKHIYEGRSGLAISVEDQGPGLPPNAFELIFERFYTDRPPDKFGQHSGLGLSISKQIIEAHGGYLWACNRLSPEQTVLGAQFTLWLPA